MKILNYIKRNVIQPIYYFSIHNFNLLKESFKDYSKIDHKKIPIIINNCNRLTFLVRFIKSLENKGYTNIYILDNNSSYPPLLEYYDKECPYKIFRLKENYGHLSLWLSGVFELFKDNFYVYSDADLEVIEECPEDFLLYFLNTLRKNKKFYKVGFSLKYDDLPDHFALKKEVIDWESKFYDNPFNDNLYYAHIDTTFALYRPGASGGSHEFKTAVRSSYPYTIKHLPWYDNSEELSDEEHYYKAHARTSTFWTNK